MLAPLFDVEGLGGSNDDRLDYCDTPFDPDCRRVLRDASGAASQRAKDHHRWSGPNYPRSTRRLQDTVRATG